jgi:octaprenyl-diphosphate synthase
LIDDALDYAGNESEIGKRVGDDLREGKPTLPLIHVMAKGSVEEKTLVREAILHPEQANFDAVVKAIGRTGAMQYTLDSAARECELARNALAPLTNSAHKQALLDLLAFVVERKS